MPSNGFMVGNKDWKRKDLSWLSKYVSGILLLLKFCHQLKHSQALTASE